MTALRPDVRDLIDSATRDEAGPSTATRARMKAAIAAQVAGSLVIAGAAEAAPSGAASGAGVGVGVVTKVVVTSALATVMASGAWQWMRDRAAPAAAPIVAPAAPARVEVPPASASVEGVVEAEIIEPSPPPPAPAPRPTVRVPAPAPVAPPVGEVDEHEALVRGAAEALAEESALLEAGEEEAAELALVQAIESALAAGNGARARTLFDRLSAEHPQATPDDARRTLESRVRRALEPIP